MTASFLCATLLLLIAQPGAASAADAASDQRAVEAAGVRANEPTPANRNARPPVRAVDAITPDLAKALYDGIAPLRESDGCRLTRFDTSGERITVGLQPASGGERSFELATSAHLEDASRKIGGWAMAVPDELRRDCAPTLAAIERVLADTAPPKASRWQITAAPLRPLGQSDQGETTFPDNYGVLAISFVLLVLGTVHILYRELKAQRPSPYAVLALVLVWAIALALRLFLSPRTFLHEFYHIAETVPGYLTGDIGPAYGKTGPALFRLVGALLGRPTDEQLIFLTNAVISSLAIPAVALLDLALMRSWPRALCAAALLCVLPQHLRFSAAEDLFVQAVTFGMWSLGLFALYARTRRLEDALVGVLALSLAVQARPEMLFFPAVVVAMLLLVAEPRVWRMLFEWRTLLALAMLGVLLVPRFFELGQALHQAAPTIRGFPDLGRYAGNLVLFQSQVTPPVYWVLLLVGLAWAFRRKPGLDVWVMLVFFGYTLFSFTLFDNRPYHLRSQLLPTSFVVLIAAGAAPVWVELWGRRRRLALWTGASVLAVLSVVIVLRSKPFVTELRDQQLEWAFLERTVPRLPKQATLLTAVEGGGRNLDAFPDFLLGRADKAYHLVDVRRVASEDAPWPTPGEDLIYYQGMFCYFAFQEEASPDPMTAPCRAVHERYVLEPLFIEDLHTQGYSWLRYSDARPFRIGFYRLTAAP